MAGLSRPEDVLIVGDKIQTDIRGGKNAGWKTCWYNPGKLDNYKKDLTPDLEIEDLKELL